MTNIVNFHILASNISVATSILDAAKIRYALVNSAQFNITGLGYNSAYPAIIQVKAEDKERVSELLMGL